MNLNNLTLLRKIKKKIQIKCLLGYDKVIINLVFKLKECMFKIYFNSLQHLLLTNSALFSNYVCI